MISKRIWIAVFVFAGALSISAVALGRHHRPFSHSPVRPFMAPSKGHTLVLPMGRAVEPSPVVAAG